MLESLLPIPPNIPGTLIDAYDEEGKAKIRVNEAPLKETLRLFRDFVVESSIRGLTQLKSDIDAQVLNLRRESSSALTSTLEELIARTAAKERVQKLEDKFGNFEMQVSLVEQRLARLGDRVKKLQKSDTNASFMPFATDEQEHEDGGGGASPLRRGTLLGIGAAGPAQGPARSQSMLPQGDQSFRRGKLNGSMLMGSSTLGSDAEQAVMKGLAALAQKSEEVGSELRKMIQQVDAKLDSKIDAERDFLLGRCDLIQEKCAEMETEIYNSLEHQGYRLNEKLTEEVARLEAQFFGDLRQMREHMDKRDDDTDAAVAVLEETLTLKIRDAAAIGEQALKHTDEIFRPLERRVYHTEAELSHLAAGVKEQNRQILVLNKGIKDQAARVQSVQEEAEQRTSAAVEELEATLQARCSDLAMEDANAVIWLERHDHQLGLLGSRLDLIADKASQEEVDQLRASLTSIAEGLREKEQAVLFGARCLSCNRVFDDVQQDAGAVNLRAAKTKAQVFAEIQRAMRSPRTNPNEPIKLLAVKVGRPATVRTKEGQHYASRDISQYSFELEDVQLLPIRTSLGSERRTLSPPRGGTQDYSPSLGNYGLGGSPHAAGDLSMTFSASASVGLASPGPPQTPRRPNTTGGADFKHPLPELLGRAGTWKSKT